MGRNGVGKTTLLDCIMGLNRISRGEIKYGGAEITQKPAETRVPLGIAYVPQGRMIFPLLTVEENLRVGLSSHRVQADTIPAVVFDIFPVLKDMLNRKGGDLSGGQQQQLAIGRALVTDPQLLILDEPTEGLQPNIVQEIGEVILQFNKELGITVLLVEQKLPFVRRVADRFIILEKGRVVAQGEISKLSDELISQYLTV
jgi:urea transport system ATP-binding protein